MKTAIKTIVNVEVLERADEESWSLDKFEVTSDYPNIAAKGQDPKALLNHVKGACICALGDLIREVPDKVEIEFVVTRRTSDRG